MLNFEKFAKNVELLKNVGLKLKILMLSIFSFIGNLI